MNILYSVIGFIILISILVIGHEFGHFIIAKINGVKVEEFSIGMGPKLGGFKGKETQYSVRALPIGGYVKMLGEEEENNDERSFSTKSPGRKLSIIAAGPIMNIIIAIALFGIVNKIAGTPIPVISGIEKNSPAATSGLMKGDKIVKIDDTKILAYQDVSIAINTAKGSPVNVFYERSGKVNSVVIKPYSEKVGKQNDYMIGIAGTVVKPNFFQAVKAGAVETWSNVTGTYTVIKQLIMGKGSMNDVGGPVSIFKLTGMVAKAGVINFLSFMGYISIQLAIFNIIPFPALDGGYIFLYIFEIVTRKHVDTSKVGYINYIGFVLLMLLMVLVTIKDIVNPII